MDKRKFIHYGSEFFDLSKFKKVTNSEFVSEKPQPHTGLWASPINARYGWAKYCKQNEYNLDKLEKSFTFTLEDTSNVVLIKSLDDLQKLPLCRTFNSKSMLSAYIDYEECYNNGIDAIQLYVSSADDELREAFCTWDSDDIIILNPYIIIPDKKKESGVNEMVLS